MRQKVLPLLILLTGTAPARDKVENWIRVQSPHFVVATSASEKQARKVADQFERMRALFHALFPKLLIDPGSPIIVLAVKDDKDFQSLEPKEYLAKGSLKLGGLFLRAPDKNYVLMRLEAGGEHPYSVVYHEYTHLLLAKADWMPLWLNEGLAEFYENTDIGEKDVAVGQANFSEVQLLSRTRLLPLATLFAVDFNSPYYHEESKGSIFYAESWALTHYLEFLDFQQKTNQIGQYGELLAKKTDPLTAASMAFGDLKKLEKELGDYIYQSGFKYLKVKTPTEVDNSLFTSTSMTVAQADAIRADFLAYNQRTQDARTLLDHVLHDDPKNVGAHETMGFLEFREGHLEEAKKWYGEAVQLDSQNYLAHYYFAAISMQATGDPSADKQIESSLRAAIKLNPTFAPPFDRLAVFLGSRNRDLDEARMMSLNAIMLDPSNVGYRVNMASVFMHMGQSQNAVNVLRLAIKVAKTPEESALANEALLNAQAFATAQEEAKERQERVSEAVVTSDDMGNPSADSAGTGKIPRLVRRESVPSGPHHFVTGVLKDVHCDSLNMDLSVKLRTKTMALHADNYYKVQFTTLGFQPSGDLNPCMQLEGRPAKVEYVEPPDKSKSSYVLAIELHK